MDTDLKPLRNSSPFDSWSTAAPDAAHTPAVKESLQPQPISSIYAERPDLDEILKASIVTEPGASSPGAGQLLLECEIQHGRPRS